MSVPNHTHPALIVLKALLEGRKVQLPNGFTYCWHDGQVWIVGMRSHISGQPAGEGAPVLLSTHSHMTLDYFIAQCEELSFSDVFLIGAETALQELARAG